MLWNLSPPSVDLSRSTDSILLVILEAMSTISYLNLVLKSIILLDADFTKVSSRTSTLQTKHTISIVKRLI